MKARARRARRGARYTDVCVHEGERGTCARRGAATRTLRIEQKIKMAFAIAKTLSVRAAEPNR